MFYRLALRCSKISLKWSYTVFDPWCVWAVQVYWNSLSRTYWVHWHMIEILGNGSSGQTEKETQEKASSLTETLKLTNGNTYRHLWESYIYITTIHINIFNLFFVHLYSQNHCYFNDFNSLISGYSVPSFSPVKSVLLQSCINELHLKSK